MKELSMVIWRVLLVMLVLGPAWAEDVRAQGAFTVKYGNAPDQVGRDTSPGSPREYVGPSSIRAGTGGEVLVCDPINHRVHRFAPGGKLLDTITIPAVNTHDAELVALDAAVDRDLNLCILELADRNVLRFSAKKTMFLNPWKIPFNENGSAIFNAIATDPAGEIMVFDGFDNRVIRFDRKGNTDELTPGVAQSLLMDKSARFLSLDIDGQNARNFSIARVDPATGQKDKPLAVTLAEPANQLQLLGVDDAGRMYVECTFGAIEKPSSRQVLVISPEGKLLEGIAVPQPPTAYRMVSSRVVLPGGGLLTATDTPQGLEIRPHALAR